MIVDANLLLFAVDSRSPDHAAAREWLESCLNGEVRLGLPWQTLGAFLRISTHPRIMTDPLTADEAQAYVEEWLDRPPAWVPPATERTAQVHAGLARRHRVTGNLVPDAQLAALALEHGVAVASADSDFARFPEVRWVNPLRES